MKGGIQNKAVNKIMGDMYTLCTSFDFGPCLEPAQVDVSWMYLGSALALASAWA